MPSKSWADSTIRSGGLNIWRRGLCAPSYGSGRCQAPTTFRLTGILPELGPRGGRKPRRRLSDAESSRMANARAPLLGSDTHTQAGPGRGH